MKQFDSLTTDNGLCKCIAYTAWAGVQGNIQNDCRWQELEAYDLVTIQPMPLQAMLVVKSWCDGKLATC